MLYQELAGVAAIGTFLHTEAEVQSKTTYGIVAAMLTETSPSTIFGSRYLTIAVIGTVVLINSVAWGIPLLVGPQAAQSQSDRTARTELQRKQVNPGTVKATSSDTEKNTQTAATIPLPKRAPTLIIKRPVMTAPPAVSKSPRQSGAPTTLFPIPEPRPTQLLVKPAKQNERRFSVDIDRHAFADLANASPYAPRRQTEPSGHQQAWQHLSNRTDTYVSPLATAKTIARRASQRFKQVRERLANIDRDTNESKPSAELKKAPLLALTAKQPAVVATSRSSTKSAYNDVRPTFVQRPIEIELKQVSPTTAPRTPKQNRKTAEAEKKTQPHSRSLRRVVARRSSTSVRLELHRKRLQALKANAKRRKRAQKLRQARARRLAVLRQQSKVQSRKAKPRAGRMTASRTRPNSPKHFRVARVPRRTPTMVNGYRKSFHRDLMMSNFFRSAK